MTTTNLIVSSEIGDDVRAIDLAQAGAGSFRLNSNSGPRKHPFSACGPLVRLLLAAAGFALSTEATIAAGVAPQIKHVIIIMQENRSFDHYFGTFPGANGIPPAFVCHSILATPPRMREAFS